MEDTYEAVAARGGARFFDRKRRDLGWATKVLKRKPSLGGLTVLDVTTSEPSLASCLVTLDRDRLFVTSGDVFGESYAFAWASGYSNGREIRIQGMLEGR